MTIEKHTVIMITLGTKACHHHFGVLPSATPAIASEIQAMDRWLATIGSRSSSAGGALTTMPATCCGALGAISVLPIVASAILPLLHSRLGMGVLVAFKRVFISLLDIFVRAVWH